LRRRGAVPARDLDAIFFVPDGPEIRFEDGLFHVCYVIGKQARFEIVLTPKAFLVALRHANRIADEFHEGKCEVVPIKGRRK
jgi:hypothetical protein